VGPTESQRIGYGHTRMLSSVCKSTSWFTCDPRRSTQCQKGIRRRGMVSPAVNPHGTWATGPFWLTSRDPPRVAGLEGTQPRKGGDRRGEVDAGAGTAASVRRRYAAGGRVPCLVGRPANLCARACAWVRTCVEVSDSGLGPALAVNRRRGGDHDKAQAGSMGGGGQAIRSSGTNACVWKRRPVARCALADQEDGAPFSVTACVKQTPTARPWRRS
jgi:hypothetical protein